MHSDLLKLLLLSLAIQNLWRFFWRSSLWLEAPLWNKFSLICPLADFIPWKCQLSLCLPRRLTLRAIVQFSVFFQSRDNSRKTFKLAKPIFSKKFLGYVGDNSAMEWDIFIVPRRHILAQNESASNLRILGKNVPLGSLKIWATPIMASCIKIKSGIANNCSWFNDIFKYLTMSNLWRQLIADSSQNKFRSFQVIQRLNSIDWMIIFKFFWSYLHLHSLMPLNYLG